MNKQLPVKIGIMLAVFFVSGFAVLMISSPKNINTFPEPSATSKELFTETIAHPVNTEEPITSSSKTANLVKTPTLTQTPFFSSTATMTIGATKKSVYVPSATATNESVQDTPRPTETKQPTPPGTATPTQIHTETPQIVTEEPPPPPPTETTDAPPLMCPDYVFIEDITIPAGTELRPGEQFTKTWRIKNTDICHDDWQNRTYILMPVDGGNMGARPTPVNLTVKYGETIEIFIMLTAPTMPGTYSGAWRLNTGDKWNYTFGDNLAVEIIVK